MPCPCRRPCFHSTIIARSPPRFIFGLPRFERIALAAAAVSTRRPLTLAIGTASATLSCGAACPPVLGFSRSLLAVLGDGGGLHRTRFVGGRILPVGRRRLSLHLRVLRSRAQKILARRHAVLRGVAGGLGHDDIPLEIRPALLPLGGHLF